MYVQVLNTDLSVYGIVTGFESLEFIRSFNARGNFKLKINCNNKNAQYIKIDKIVYIDADKIGYIHKVTIDRNTDKAGEYIIAEGIELKDNLNRLIYPDGGYTNIPLETVVKSLINKNAGNEAEENRKIPNLTTADDLERWDLIDYSAWYKDLTTEIYSLLSSKQKGLTATIDFDKDEVVFDIVEGNDLRAVENEAGGIVLSLDTKTALEITDTEDKLSYKNLSVTAGLENDSGRTIVEVYDNTKPLPTGYERLEVFTNAKDIKSDSEISIRGAQKLAEISKTRAVTVKANTLGSYQIGNDYDLGDFIGVDANGNLFNAQVVKLKYKYTKESIPEIEVILNFDIEDIMISDISAKHMDYDAEVATETSVGNSTYLGLSDTPTSRSDKAGHIPQVQADELKDSYAQIVAGSNMTITNVDGTITFASGGGGGNLVAEVTLESAASSITIEDLDINADGSVYELFICGRMNSAAYIQCFVNDDNDELNYWNQYVLFNGTSVSSNRYNNARFAAISGAQAIVYAIIARNPVNGGVMIQANTTYSRGSAVQRRTFDLTPVNTFTNITKLKITSYNNFAAGTIFKIYKRS